MIGFWYGIGVMLAVGVADSLNHFVRAVTRGNKVTANKMAEQVQQVTMKDPKKVEAGKRLAKHNHRNRKELKAQRQRETKLTYYGAGAVVAIGVLGVIGIAFTNPRLQRRLLLTNLKKLQLTNPRKLQPINLIWIRL